VCGSELTYFSRLPLPGAIPQYCARYVDPAMGFAVGWNNWYQSAITLCAEISAAAIVIGFWNDEINQAAWISIIIVLVICLNIFAVSIYGEAEFIFASIKIITIVCGRSLFLLYSLYNHQHDKKLSNQLCSIDIIQSFSDSITDSFP
jgi:amino acid transporter